MKTTIRTLLAALLLLAAPTLDIVARNPHPLAYNGFSGGMMLHTGYLSVGSIAVGVAPAQAMKGLPMGIGGALKVRFGEHLRVGTEGYASALSYGDYGSSLSIGWGGLLVDYLQPLGGRWAVYAGATIGGGKVENLTLTTEPEVDILPELNTSYRTYAAALLVPFVGVEYSLTERMSLTLKTDYMTPLGRHQFDFPEGVRCYVGFMFNH